MATGGLVVLSVLVHRVACGSSAVPFGPTACQSFDELKIWRAGQMAYIKDITPSSWQNFLADRINQDFSKRVEELGEVPADERDSEFNVPPPSVAECAALTKRAVVRLEPKETMELPLLFMTAKMCQSAPDLLLWYDCQFAELVGHTPSLYAYLVAPAVRGAFRRRLAELNSQASLLSSSADVDLPVPLLVAEQCPNLAELEAWRMDQMQQVERRLPLQYRRFAGDAVQATFRRRLSEISHESSSERDTAPAKAKGSMAAAVRTVEMDESSAEPQRGTLASVGAVLFGLALPVFVAFVMAAARGKKPLVQSNDDRVGACGIHIQPSIAVGPCFFVSDP